MYVEIVGRRGYVERRIRGGVEKVREVCGGGGEERASGEKNMESNRVSKCKLTRHYPLIPLTRESPPHLPFSPHAIVFSPYSSEYAVE